ncbi:MAG: hypothetical protein ACYDER_29165 [Ktedonobacteraceae bacterium]
MGTSINDLIRVLESVLGYELEKGGDHVRYVLKINGKIIARTKFSRSWRGNQQISEPILHAQAKQMHCSARTLKLLLQGHLNKKEYLRELLEEQVITHKEFDVLCGEGSSDKDTKKN